MKYTVIKSIIRILGNGWYGQTCAMFKELNGYDVGNLEDLGLGEDLSKEQKREVQIVTNENLDGSSENWSRAVRDLAGSERFVGCGFYSAAL